MARADRRAAYRALSVWIGLILLGFVLDRGPVPSESNSEQRPELLRQERILLEECLATFKQQQALVDQADRFQGFEPVAGLILPTLPDLSPRRRSLVIGIGEERGLRRGQAVIGLGGLVGIVAEVGNGKARVQRADDFEFRVQFRVRSTGRGGLAAGGPEAGELRPFLERESLQLKEGDLLVTEGGDGRFPRGVVIGTVTEAAPLLKNCRIQLGQDLNDLGSVVVLTLPDISELEKGRRP